MALAESNENSRPPWRNSSEPPSCFVGRTTTSDPTMLSLCGVSTWGLKNDPGPGIWKVRMRRGFIQKKEISHRHWVYTVQPWCFLWFAYRTVPFGRPPWYQKMLERIALRTGKYPSCLPFDKIHRGRLPSLSQRRRVGMRLRGPRVAALLRLWHRSSWGQR